MAKLPIFAVATRANIQPAIDAGILHYPSYVFCSDDNHFAFVDKNNNLQEIVGDNPNQVEFVTELPGTASAKQKTLYIKDFIAYVFDGEKFVPMFQDYTTQINDLITRLDTIESTVETVQTNVTDLGSKVETIETNVGTLQSDVSSVKSDVSTIQTNVSNLQDSVQAIEKGSSGLVFSDYASLPEVGESNKLYIDESESTGGIYSYDEATNTYIKLSSAESSSSIQFIELKETTE